MTKTARTLMRAPLQIAICALMVFALVGPHSAWSVCLTGKCDVRTEAAGSCCSCCHDDAGDERRDDGDGENGAETCVGCCVDLAMAIEEGPMPKPIVTPDIDERQVVAVLPPMPPTSSSAVAARYLGHDTGPPRVDRRTALIATTVLRE